MRYLSFFIFLINPTLALKVEAPILTLWNFLKCKIISNYCMFVITSYIISKNTEIATAFGEISLFENSQKIGNTKSWVAVYEQSKNGFVGG